MEDKQTLVEIDRRYSALAASDCCLSCGGAARQIDVAEGHVCLDLGSGRGTDALRLAGIVGPTGMVYGIDVSAGMIGHAKSIADKLGIRNVSFIQSSLESLPIESDSIDRIVSNCTINHATDKQAVWNEINRVLKRNGKFVVSDIYATAAVPGEYRNDPQAIAECWAGASTREEYLGQITRADLVLDAITAESAPYAKGKIEVASFTLHGHKKNCNCR